MDNWMNHPSFQKLDPVKQELFKAAAKQTSGKSGKSMAPVMLSIISNANKRGISFTPEDFTLIISILKDGKTENEKRQIDQMVSMIQQMKNNVSNKKKN